MAAQRRVVCVPYGVLTGRAQRIAIFILLFAIASPAAPRNNSGADASPVSSPPHSNARPPQSSTGNQSLSNPPAQSPAVPVKRGIIQRIEFVGNRRIRSDTLKARIFSREGDAYNEETLRRDFQALWNTQFFEDVKLRVEDAPSPDHPDAKNIIFDVKERPVIRRIRYDGIHSISESDILDRFKERKVGLSVESQFDPTKIKKAEVVLRELLGEHGRQFAKVTPRTPTSRSSVNLSRS